MTNKKLESITSDLVDEVCAKEGFDPRPGQKGGNREEANFIVVRALREVLPGIRKSLGLSATPTLAIKEEEAA